MAQPGWKGHKRTHQILIVDDEPEIRRLCRFALEAEDRDLGVTKRLTAYWPWR